MAQNSDETADPSLADAPPPPGSSRSDVPSATGDGVNPRTAILKRIRAHTRRAAPQKRWTFLEATPWVRQLKGTADALQAALRTEFAEDALKTAGVLVPGPGDALTLAPVIGDSTSRFVILCEPAATPIDVISARGVLSGPQPPCLRYSNAHKTNWPYGPVQQLAVAVTDDAAHVLHRLGCAFTSAAGLETLSSKSQVAVTRARAAEFPAIASLGLTAEHLRALAFQGFVSEERRRGQAYYKLRFRFQEKQRVRYLGGIESARAVEAELEVLQSGIRHRRRLAALSRAGSQQLRSAKQALQPFLEAQGLHFHGQAIRKHRAAKADIC